MKTQDYSAILVALVAWQQAGHVIKLIKHWLVQEFNGKGCAPGSGSIEVDKKKTKVTLEMGPLEDVFLYVSSLG